MKFLIILSFLLFIYCSKNSENLDGKYKQAVTHFHRKELNEALRVFIEIKKENSEYRDTGLFIGKIYYYAGNFPAAAEVLLKSSKQKPANLNISIWYLKSLLASKKDNEEKESLLIEAEKLTELDSSNLELLNILARLYLDTKKIDKAIVTYRRILLFEDNLSMAHFELSKLYALNDLNKEKEFHLEKAIIFSNQNKKLIEAYQKGQSDESKNKKK